MTDIAAQQPTYTRESFEKHSDFMYATAYAWGRSDHGANLDSNDIYAFGQAWVEVKRAFRANETPGHPSLMRFYDEFFADKKRKS